MPFTISFFVSTMAFPTFVVLLCQVAVFLSLCAVGEGRYSIFRRFKEAQDTKKGSPFEEQWFPQKLDHFNGADTRVWKQAGLHVGLYGRLFDLTVWSNLVQLDKCVIMHASVTKDKAFLAHFTATPLMCLFFYFLNVSHFVVPSQRYFINEAFYRPGGPVFLMIGGEGPANPAWMKDGTWLTYAEKLGALCLMLEHRFYGMSHPTVYVYPSLYVLYERNLYVCVVICLDNSVSNPQLHPVQRVTHTFALLQVQQV